MRIKALVHAAEEGGYWAEVPALPGCFSQGETFDEAVTNVREAIEGWLEVASERVDAASEARLVEIEV